jgi:tripartite-type tricarboxylate transporter receptor subunit TctC
VKSCSSAALRFAAALFCCLAATAVVAQEVPSKPIRFVIGPAPDLLPRLLGQKLAERWKQQVIVDQHPAAGGIVAAEIVAKAPPDGYTWLMSSASFHINELFYSNLPYRFARDFRPVTLMATLPFILVVHPSVPVNSLAELIQLARAKPGQLNYGSAGNGTSTHIVTEYLKSVAKIDIVHVPYKGVAPAITELLGGQVQVMFAIAQAGLPHVQSGKLRALAVSSAQRYAPAPELPTIAELGFPDFEMIGWNGLHVPAATPRAVVERLNTEIAQVLSAPDFRQRVLAAGFVLASTTVDAFDAFVKKDTATYAKVIREAHIRAE